MANRIFTNGEEGKILTSVGSRIIKQPYEFGNALYATTFENYIKIANLNIPLIPSTELFWSRDNNSDLSSNISTRKSPTTNNNYTRYVTGGTVRFSLNGYSEYGINQIFGNYPVVLEGDVNFFATVLGEASGLNRCNASIVTSNYNRGLIVDQTTSLIYLGIISGTTQPESPYALKNKLHAIGRYIVYSRILTSAEISYYYNNKLGSEPQSTAGLEIDLHNDFAEILDFSALQNGSDMRVGCRDYSGFNRHGEIMNLPAGTLQQKLDYANANLFVPFLT